MAHGLQEQDRAQPVQIPGPAAAAHGQLVQGLGQVVQGWVQAQQEAAVAEGNGYLFHLTKERRSNMKRILFLTAVIVSCSAVTVFAQTTSTSTTTGIQRVEQPSERSINDDQSIRTRGVGPGATINSRGVSDPAGFGANTTGGGANTTDNVLNRDPITRNIPLDTAPNAMGAQGTGTGTDSDILGAQSDTGVGNQGNLSDSDISGTVSGRTNSDRALSTRIRQDLMNNDQIAQNLDSIRINSENGRVVLLGTVNSEEQRQQIINEVERIAGVNTVEDRLRVAQD